MTKKICPFRRGVEKDHERKEGGEKASEVGEREKKPAVTKKKKPKTSKASRKLVRELTRKT